MPELDQPRCYIWTVSCFLFICTISGGTLLALYITQPADSPNTLYAVGGVALVCLPWFFWFLTFCYRIISRACGFRMVCWGEPYGAGDSFRAGGNNVGGFGGGANANAGGTANDGMVVGENNCGNVSRSSYQSQESQKPLRFSMAS